uniref:Uncharacterized protein n=1 Tax=Anguilla anguilla TaxID=7936 RepID=A0A0E9QKM4_ANGAN
MSDCKRVAIYPYTQANLSVRVCGSAA